MSRTARLIASAVVAVALSGVLAPAASSALAASGPTGIGWDVTPTSGAGPTASGSTNGIGWD